MANTLNRCLDGLTAFAAALLVSGCGVGEAKVDDDIAAERQTPLPVQSVAARFSDLYALYHATANVTADGEAQVPARIAGEVVETLVEEGDPVVKGQLLARIDAGQLEIRLRQSEARFLQRQSEYQRQVSLHERGLASSAAVESLEFEVAELKAAMELDRLNYRYSEIRAPIAGIIASRHIVPGQHMTDGELAFRIVDTSRLLAELQVPQTELSRLRAGLDVTLTVDAAPDVEFDAAPDVEFDATIARLSPTVDTESGTFRATVYIDNPDGALAPGMFGRFTVYYHKYEQVLTVPSQSIAQEDGERIVYVVNDGIAERRQVEAGVESGNRTQILSGLEAGEEVVNSGISGLRDGSRVLASSGKPGHTGA